MEQIVDGHADALVETRALVLRHGPSDSACRQWEEEVARFINSQIAGVLDRREIAELECKFEAIQAHVLRRVSDIAASPWVYT